MLVPEAFSGGWDGFDMATSGSFLNLSPGPIGWNELRTMGLTPAGDDLFSIVDDVRAVRVAALADWGHGFDMPNSRFNFAAGDMVSISGTVTGTHTNRHVQLNSRPGYYRPIARHFGDGSFELDVTLNADDVFTINDSFPSALRFEVRETGTTAIVRNVRIVRPNQGVIFDMASSADFLGAPHHLRDDDLLAALGLGRVYGEFSFVDNVRALQITTDADWGQGVDLSQVDFNFSAGDMVSVRGTVAGLGASGRVTLNSNLGGASNFVSEHTGDGTFELGVQLTQAHISGIAAGNPQALRFEVRATGARARIHNIRVVRAGDPGNGNGGDPGNGDRPGNGNGGDPIGGIVVATPSFWAGIDRMFHFPNQTVIFERDGNVGWGHVLHP